MKNTLRRIGLTALLGVALAGCSQNEKSTNSEQYFKVDFIDGTSYVFGDVDGDGNVDYVKPRPASEDSEVLVRPCYDTNKIRGQSKQMTPSQLRASQDLYEAVKWAKISFKAKEDSKK